MNSIYGAVGNTLDSSTKVASEKGHVEGVKKMTGQIIIAAMRKDHQIITPTF